MSVLHNTSAVSDISVTAVTNGSNALPVPEGCITRQGFTFIPWDNEHNLVSKEVENTIRFLFLGLCLPVFFVVGFSTNIVNMVVFYKHGLEERINACLFTLSLVDLLGVFVAYCFNSDAAYMFIMGKERELGPSGQFFIGNQLVGLYGFVTSSQMVYGVITVERCLCITRPLLVKNLISTKKIVIALWVMTFIVTGGNMLVTGVRYSALCVFEPADNSISYVSYPTDFYFRHQFIMDIMYSVVYGLLLPGLSLVCVIVSTIITAVELKKLSKWRESVSTASESVTSRDVALTRVIIGTSILFILCVVPTVIMRSSFLFVPDLRVGGRYDNLAWVTIRFFQLFSAINNTFNFFIYYIFGSKFRETTHRLFPCWRHDMSNKDKTMSSSSVKKISSISQ
ncbi:hypothetical protein ACOMHN_056276 [Nucella lapillus]